MKNTKIFSQYVELPKRMYDVLGGNFKPLDMVLYSIMMNHQDYAHKQGRQYRESLSSLAYLTNTDERTIRDKLKYFQEKNLIKKIARNRKTSVWEVKHIERDYDQLVAVPERESNTARSIRLKAENISELEELFASDPKEIEMKSEEISVIEKKPEKISDYNVESGKNLQGNNSIYTNSINNTNSIEDTQEEETKEDNLSSDDLITQYYKRMGIKR